MPLCRL